MAETEEAAEEVAVATAGASVERPATRTVKAQFSEVSQPKHGEGSGKMGEG